MGRRAGPNGGAGFKREDGLAWLWSRSAGKKADTAWRIRGYGGKGHAVPAAAFMLCIDGGFFAKRQNDDCAIAHAADGHGDFARRADTQMRLRSVRDHRHQADEQQGDMRALLHLAPSAAACRPGQSLFTAFRAVADCSGPLLLLHCKPWAKTLIVWMI